MVDTNSGKSEQFDYLFKIVLIGDTNVGKSNLVKRLTTNEYNASSRPTIGVEFATKTFEFDGDIIKAQIWDTAGQERYRAITTAYYRGSAGAVVVFDVSNKESFKRVFSLWLKELRNAVGDDVPVVMVGNKTDLQSYREVQHEEARAKAIEAEIGFYETSALTGDNVSLTFEKFTRQIYEKEKEVMRSTGKAKVRREDLVGERLEAPEKKKPNSGCC